MRGHNTSGRYYQSYVHRLGPLDTLHKKDSCIGPGPADFGEKLFHALRWIDLRLRSSRLPLRVLYRPLESVVCYLLPSVLPHREVRPSRELLVVRNALDVAVVLDVRLVDRWRHQVVLSTRYEEQWRPVFVPEVAVGVLVARREVGQHRVPNEAARSGDVVALVGLV